MTGRCAIAAREYIPIEDRVRDVMLLTLPGLRADGEDISVDSDVQMMDDGMDAVFFEAFIRDEIPWMDLRHEVRDLMLVAVPSLTGCEDACIEDCDMPDDGIAIDWSEPAEVPEAACAVPAIAPAPAVLAIAAAAAPAAIAPAAACAALTAPVTLALPASESVPAIAPAAAPAEEPVATVSESSNICWRVCFSF